MTEQRPPRRSLVDSDLKFGGVQGQSGWHYRTSTLGADDLTYNPTTYS